MKKKLLKGALAIFSLILLAYLALQVHNHKRNQADRTRTISANKRILDEIDAQTGKLFPDLALLDEKGNKRHLNEYASKVVFLDFWWTRCVPCIEQHPSSAALQARFEADTNVVFINIAIEEDFNRWTDYLAANEVAGHNLFLEHTHVFTGKEFGVSSFPTYAVLGAENKIMGLTSGSVLRPGAAKMGSDKLVSNINADWILLEAKEGITAREALIKYYTSDSEYGSWVEKYRGRYEGDFAL
jgi:thiol-disulfide isomerase/thioredoxin